ncbi:DUF2972 domain-containing protein [Campylobacter jejuni]|nr:DUF2972 domain-containing protein [Campylobacter jejuni]
MHNPQSATERIKNSLSYKLGFAILEHKKQYRRGFLILIYKLYKIKKQHFKDQKLYKQIIKIFPQLAYPKLETCSDYNESIKYKYHLSYMLGEVLIYAHKTWYKGGYFKLYKNIQIIKRQYNLLKELNLNNIDISLENKELLINNFEAIKDILQTHKDYKPILENIFHNFKFFLANLTLIKEWLLSDDFYQRYKKENHPYPSLLDPKKLNNDSEEINYKNIPAELAWEMNLPLPDKYKFIYWCSHGTGGTAFMYFMAKIGLKTVSVAYEDGLKSFVRIYNMLLGFRDDAFLTVRNYISGIDGDKLYALMQVEYGVNIARDPIEMLKHYICMKREAGAEKKIFTILHNPDEVVKKLIYYHDCKGLSYRQPNIDKENIIFWLELKFSTFHDSQLRSKLIHIKEDIFFDMNDFTEDNIVKSINKIIKFFNLNIKCKITDGFQVMSNNFSYLPLILSYHNEDIKSLSVDPNYLQRKDSINFYIIDRKFAEYNSDFVFLKRHWFANFYEFTKDPCINITHLFSPLDEDIFVVIKKEQFFRLTDGEIFYIKEYLNKLFVCLKNEKNKSTINNSKRLLHYLYDNYQLVSHCRARFEEHIKFIKKYRPDIVASWKYYQEFEKL